MFTIFAMRLIVFCYLLDVLQNELLMIFLEEELKLFQLIDSQKRALINIGYKDVQCKCIVMLLLSSNSGFY